MDVRVGLWRKLSTEELMLLNCGVAEDSWESHGLQGDPTSPFWRRSVLGVHWKDWCWSWNSKTLAILCEGLTHWKRPWCWGRLEAGGEGDDRGWDGWMASRTNGHEFEWIHKCWWGSVRPGMLRFMESQSRTWLSNWTELNWTDIVLSKVKVAHSCPTLRDPTDYSSPGSSVHGIFQARILEWVAIPSPGYLLNPGTEPRSPALQAYSLLFRSPGKPNIIYTCVKVMVK